MRYCLTIYKTWTMVGTDQIIHGGGGGTMSFTQHDRIQFFLFIWHLSKANIFVSQFPNRFFFQNKQILATPPPPDTKSDLPTNAAYLKHLLVTAFCVTGQKFSGLELGLRLCSRLCRLLGLRSTKNIHVQRFQHILDKITMRHLTRIIAVSSML